MNEVSIIIGGQNPDPGGEPLKIRQRGFGRSVPLTCPRLPSRRSELEVGDRLRVEKTLSRCHDDLPGLTILGYGLANVAGLGFI